VSEPARYRARRPLWRVLLDAFLAGVYILCGFPLAIAYVSFFSTGIGLGFGLLPVFGVGAVILAMVVFAATLAMRLERALAIHMLSAQIPPLTFRRRRDTGFWGSLKDVLSNAALWKGIAFLVVKLPLTLVAFVVALIPISLAAGFALAPLLSELGLGSDIALTSSGSWITGLMAIPTAIVAVGLLDGLGSLLRRLATFFLSSPPPADRMVRESLAEGLGDESLTIAYWLPEREIFVDDQGHQVEVPAKGSGRAWTPVEHEGKLLAGIVHRADLADSDIVRTAGTAAVLQLENERLRADLRARLDELRASRSRIVEASDETRRRLERNLHDGAQQQLVALALQLRMARGKATDPESEKLLDGALEQLDQALSDLRELARGIHPAILSERGLKAAVGALAERQPLPTEVEYELERKLDPTVEATAYFVIAEGLANVAKHAQAKTVTIGVREKSGRLEVAVSDDGRGGANLRKGTGLRGLEERLLALDGTLRVRSPKGKGTRLTASIPLPAKSASDPAAKE
jgi:signal transduction histidine kinase